MEIIDVGSEKKHTIVLPLSCVDPKDYKVGDDIEYKIHGKVKATDESYGTTVELDEGEHEEDMDEFESMDDEGQKKKIKKQMSNLEEYD